MRSKPRSFLRICVFTVVLSLLSLSAQATAPLSAGALALQLVAGYVFGKAIDKTSQWAHDTPTPKELESEIGEVKEELADLGAFLKKTSSDLAKPIDLLEKRILRLEEKYEDGLITEKYLIQRIQHTITNSQNATLKRIKNLEARVDGMENSLAELQELVQGYLERLEVLEKEKQEREMMPAKAQNSIQSIVALARENMQELHRKTKAHSFMIACSAFRASLASEGKTQYVEPELIEGYLEFLSRDQDFFKYSFPPTEDPHHLIIRVHLEMLEQYLGLSHEEIHLDIAQGTFTYLASGRGDETTGETLEALEIPSCRSLATLPVPSALNTRNFHVESAARRMETARLKIMQHADTASKIELLISQVLEVEDHIKAGEFSTPPDVASYTRDIKNLRKHLRNMTEPTSTSSLLRAEAIAKIASFPKDWRLNQSSLPAKSCLPHQLQPPFRVSGNDPDYTDMGRKARVEGYVVLAMVIDESGQARNIKTLKNLPAGLSQAAATAVQNWTFSPAKCNGEPVESKHRLEIEFRL